MKRSNSFTRRGTSSRFRSRGRARLKNARSPGVYEASDFFIEFVTQLPSGSASETLVYFNLASIDLSLLGGSSAVGTPVGSVLSAMVRKLQVGGVVFDYGVEFQNQLDGADTSNTDYAYFMHGLLYDRLESGALSSGQPASVAGWSPFQSAFPIAALTATTPSIETSDNQHPTRLLWNKTRYRSVAARTIVNSNAELLYVPNEQLLAPREATVNRRFRVLLDDEQGLFLSLATRNSPDFAGGTTPRGYRAWWRGTLYWRYIT